MDEESRSPNGTVLLVAGGAIVVGLVLLAIILVITFNRPMAPNAEAPRPDMPAQPNPAVQQPPLKPLGSPVPNAPAQPAPPPGVAGKPTIDLVPLIDAARDPIHGRWLIVNNVLHCNDMHFVPRIQIPYQPPAEYDFTVTCSQPTLRNGISLIMPNPGGGSFFWALGGDNGSTGTLNTSPPLRCQLPRPLAPRTVFSTTVQVRRDGVTVLLDGVVLVEHKTNFKDLSSDDWRRLADASLLGVACDDPTVFHFVQVVEIAGAGKRTR